MNQEITLVNRGRGLQLSTSRITVMDLVQYFKRGCSDEEIVVTIPSLTPEELALVEAYYREHKAELDDKVRQVEEYREKQRELRRQRFPRIEDNTVEFIGQ